MSNDYKMLAVFVAVMFVGALVQISVVHDGYSSKSTSSNTTSQQSSSNSSSSGYSGSTSGNSSSSSSSSGYSGSATGSSTYGNSSSSSSSSNGGEYHDDWIPWQDAGKHIGQYVHIRGVVKSVRTEETKNGTTTFINIGEDYPNENRVTAVIWPNHRDDFASSPLSAQYLSPSMVGNTVCISGVIKDYKGVAQIQLDLMSQIHRVYV